MTTFFSFFVTSETLSNSSIILNQTNEKKWLGKIRSFFFLFIYFIIKFNFNTGC